MTVLGKVALFAGGMLFGSVGLNALTSEKAKKVYVGATAAVLRGKDTVMKTYEKIQENAGDILADAKDLNARREDCAQEVSCEKIEDTSKED